MAQARPVTNLLGLAVLGTLAQRPMHRYEIATTIREQGKDDDMGVKWGSLYTVVKQPRAARLRRGHRHRAGRRPPRAHDLPDHRRRPPRDGRVDARAASPAPSASTRRSPPACRCSARCRRTRWWRCSGPARAARGRLTSRRAQARGVGGSRCRGCSWSRTSTASPCCRRRSTGCAACSPSSRAGTLPGLAMWRARTTPARSPDGGGATTQSSRDRPRAVRQHRPGTSLVVQRPEAPRPRGGNQQ